MQEENEQAKQALAEAEHVLNAAAVFAQHDAAAWADRQIVGVVASERIARNIDAAQQVAHRIEGPNPAIAAARAPKEKTKRKHLTPPAASRLVQATPRARRTPRATPSVLAIDLVPQFTLTRCSNRRQR